MPGRIGNTAVWHVALTERQLSIVVDMAKEGYELDFIADRIGRSREFTRRLVGDMRLAGKLPKREKLQRKRKPAKPRMIYKPSRPKDSV